MLQVKKFIMIERVLREESTYTHMKEKMHRMLYLLLAPVVLDIVREVVEGLL